VVNYDPSQLNDITGAIVEFFKSECLLTNTLVGVTALSADGLVPIMGRRGNCFDNAAVEFFFRSLNKEKIRRYIFKTREHARAEKFEHIEVSYNRARTHRHIGNISLEVYEK